MSESESKTEQITESKQPLFEEGVNGEAETAEEASEIQVTEFVPAPSEEAIRINSVVLPQSVEPLNSATLAPPPVEYVQQPVEAPKTDVLLAKCPGFAVYNTRFAFENVTLIVYYLGATKKAKLHNAKAQAFSMPVSDITMIVATREKHNAVKLRFVADNAPFFNSKGKIFALNRVEWTVIVPAGSLGAIGDAIKATGVDLVVTSCKQD